MSVYEVLNKKKKKEQEKEKKIERSVVNEDKTKCGGNRGEFIENPAVRNLIFSGSDL